MMTIAESKKVKQNTLLVTLTRSAKVRDWYQITGFVINGDILIPIGDTQKKNLYEAYSLYENIN